MASQININTQCDPGSITPIVVTNYTGVITPICVPQCPVDVNVLSMPAVTPTTTYDVEPFMAIDAVTGHSILVTNKFDVLTGASIAGYPQYFDSFTGTTWVGSPATLTQTDFEIVANGKTELCMSGVNVTREDYTNTDPNGPAIPSIFRNAITGAIFTPTPAQLAGMVTGFCVTPATPVADNPYREELPVSSVRLFTAGTIKSLTYTVIGTGATLLPAFTGVTQNLLDGETATFTADNADALTADLTFTTTATSQIIFWIVEL